MPSTPNAPAPARPERSGPQRLINAYIESKVGPDRPGFYDVATHFPHLLEIDRGWADIRAEADEILKMRDAMPRYHDVDQRQTNLTSTDAQGQSWKVFPLFLMGIRPQRTRAMCPRTVALVDRVPNLFQAMFSVLEPGKSIAAHTGPYMGYLRYHLGVRVPTENPPSIRVGTEWYTWQEGKSIVLDDSLEHEVVNHSTDIRVVLIVDVLRPLPRVAHLVNHFVSRAVIRRIYANRVAENLERIRFTSDAE